MKYVAIFAPIVIGLLLYNIYWSTINKRLLAQWEGHVALAERALDVSHPQLVKASIKRSVVIKNWFGNKQRLDELWGFKSDSTGLWVVEPEFANVGEYYLSGLVPARSVNTQAKSGWGYIDSSGKWVIQPRYSMAYGFLSKRGRVYRLGSDRHRLYQYVDTKGNTIPGQYDYAEDFVDGYALVGRETWISKLLLRRLGDSTAYYLQSLGLYQHTYRYGIIDIDGDELHSIPKTE